MEGDIEWYYPESGKGVDASINDIISHIPGVEREIQHKARSLGSEAWVQLLWHRHTGAAKIEVSRHPSASPRTPDWYVYLLDADPGGGNYVRKNRMDRSAMSIEFGWTTKSGKRVDGLNILGSVMDRAARKYRGPK
jgi:hypothetical protein